VPFGLVIEIFEGEEHSKFYPNGIGFRAARRCRTIRIRAGDHVLTAADPLPPGLRDVLKQIHAPDGAHQNEPTRVAQGSGTADSSIPWPERPPRGTLRSRQAMAGLPAPELVAHQPRHARPPETHLSVTAPAASVMVSLAPNSDPGIHEPLPWV
jgi:hypothetical protein